jgi:succinoglycan biosynthesis protein ExoU
MTLEKNGVAVIVAAHNAQGTIRRAVRSALEQKHVREVIVVDDASRDGTSAEARLEDDGSGRLATISLPENGGPSRARNIALDRSVAPCICVLDSDDYFLPGRIASLLTAKVGPWDLLADDIVIVPEEAAHTEFSVASIDDPPIGVILDLATFVNGNVSHRARLRGELGFLKPIIKREFLRKHALRYDEHLRLGEDYALYTKALMAGARFCVVGARGYVATQRQGSISARHSAQDLARIAQFDEQCLATASGLSAREQAALAAHRTATLRKFRYRAVLDTKKARGLLPAVGMLVSNPSSLPFIASETISTKAASVRRALGLSNAGRNARGDQIRLLLELPQSRLSIVAASASDA